MGLVLSAVIALAPLVIAPGILFYFDVTPKIVVLLCGTCAALLCLAASDAQRTGARAFAAVLGLFWLSLVFSTVFSADRALSLGGTNWRRLGLVTWTAVLLFAWMTAVHAAGSPARIARLLKVIAIGGSIAAVYGILQYLGWDPWLPAHAYHIGEGEWTIVRPPGTLGYATYFATYLLTVMFSGIALAWAGTRRWWRVAGLAAAVLAAVAMVLSGTRAGILGMAAGAAWLALAARPRVPSRAIAAVAIGAGLCAVFYFSPPGQKLRSRARWFVEDPLGGARVLMWRDSLEMAARRPLGTGVESFSREFPRFQSARLARAFPEFHHESAHNMFLDVATAQGVPGVLFLILPIGWGFHRGWRARAAAPRTAAALSASLAAVVAAQQFSSLVMPTALMLFVNLALLAALDTPRKPNPGGPSRRVRFACALPIACVLSVFAVRLFAADRMLERSKVELQHGRAEDSTASYGRALAWGPPGMAADLWYSRSMAMAAQGTRDMRLRLLCWQQAMDAAVRATRTSEDRHNAWYNLAVLSAAENDSAATERSLRESIAASPHWYKPHWMLAQVLRATGRLDEAAREADIALDRSGGKIPEVARTALLIRSERGGK